MYDRKIGASQVKTRQFGAIRVYGVVSGLDISKQGLLPMNEGQRHIGSFFEFQLIIFEDFLRFVQIAFFPHNVSFLCLLYALHFCIISS